MGRLGTNFNSSMNDNSTNKLKLVSIFSTFTRLKLLSRVDLSQLMEYTRHIIPSFVFGTLEDFRLSRGSAIRGRTYPNRFWDAGIFYIEKDSMDH